MKYKLICVDMDGTLLNSEKKISERNIEAVKRATEKGVQIVICTGRMFTSAKYYAELLGIKAPVISANGAYIREKDSNEVIYKSVLGKENCRKILEVVKKHGLSPTFHTTDSIIIDSMNSPYLDYMKLGSNIPENRDIGIKMVEDWEETFSMLEDEITKCITIDSDLDRLYAAKQELASISELEVVSSFSTNFEVMIKGVSKGRAVEVLAGYYNLRRDEVICIGDNENDISMIEYAGLGVAMGNSQERIKKIADFVTDSNDEDGVAKVIEKFII